MEVWQIFEVLNRIAAAVAVSLNKILHCFVLVGMNLYELNGKWYYGGGEVTVDPAAQTIDTSGTSISPGTNSFQFHLKL